MSHFFGAALARQFCRNWGRVSVYPNLNAFRVTEMPMGSNLISFKFCWFSSVAVRLVSSYLAKMLPIYERREWGWVGREEGNNNFKKPYCYKFELVETSNQISYRMTALQSYFHVNRKTSLRRTQYTPSHNKQCTPSQKYACKDIFLSI